MSSTISVEPSTYERSTRTRCRSRRGCARSRRRPEPRVSREAPVVHLRDGEERRPPRIALLEIVDTRRAHAVIVDDDVRESAAGGRLAGLGVLGLDGSELADRAVDPVDPTVLHLGHRAGPRGVAALVGGGLQLRILVLFLAEILFDRL